jgi:cobalt-zinc-cadmium efflux system outer membrane protein
MDMKKAVMAVIFILTAAVNMFADGQQAISEQYVIDAALKNNPGLIAAEKMARSYESKSHRQFFLENPMVGFDVMGVRDYTFDINSSMQKFLVITQKIPFPVKYIWKAGGAAAEADLYRYMYEMKKLETIDSARAAYYELYKTLKYIDITNGAAGVLKQLSNIAFAKYNQGAVSQQDVIKADLEADLLGNELLTLNRQKEADAQKLRQVTADESLLTGTAYSLEDPLVPELKAGFDEIKDTVIKNAPSIKASVSDMTVSDNMRNMAIADYIPDLNIMYKKSVDPGSGDYEFMVEAEIPLWFLNNQQADIGEKWEMAASKENTLEDTKSNAVSEARDHYETIKADYRLIDLYKNKLIPQAEAGLKSALASYQSKKIEFMTLLDSERMLLDMKKDYYMRLTEYLMHYRMLEELTGKLLSTND